MLLTVDDTNAEKRIFIGEHLNSQSAGEFENLLSQLPTGDAQSVVIDLSKLQTLDTTGAWLVQKVVKLFQRAGASVVVDGANPTHSALLDHVSDSYRYCEIAPPIQPVIIRILTEIGENTLRVLGLLGALMAFMLRLLATMSIALRHPGQLRWRATAYQLEAIGTRSVPIVGLIAFLIGGVLVTQGAFQLRKFGAEIFVVDMLAISIFRELGVLLTAIMVAGRSGSAFTAHIGSMKLNEEIDAMEVIGMSPMTVLVVPRLIAFVIALPVLTLFANFMGLVGGAFVAWVTLGISPVVFIERAGEALQGWSLWLGVLKAPVFAVVITVCGCFEGLMVENSAVSLGKQTTKSVVEAIFLVIVINAAFAILFTALGI